MAKVKSSAGPRQNMAVAVARLPSEQEVRDAGREFLLRVLDRPPWASAITMPAIPPSPQPRARGSLRTHRFNGRYGTPRAQVSLQMWMTSLVCLLVITMLHFGGTHIWVHFGGRLACSRQGPIVIDHVHPTGQVIRMQEFARHAARALSQAPDPGLVYSPEMHDAFDTFKDALGEVCRLAELSAQHTAGSMACSIKIFSRQHGLQYLVQLNASLEKGLARTRSLQIMLSRAIQAQLRIRHNLNSTLGLVTEERSKLHKDLSQKVWNLKPGGSLGGRETRRRNGKEQREKILEMQENVLAMTLEDLADLEGTLWQLELHTKRHHDALLQIQSATLCSKSSASPSAASGRDVHDPFLTAKVEGWFLGPMTAAFETHYQRLTPSIWLTISTQSWASP
ncbi:uncharacterized protein A1O5_09729 [Cladophialophora psammophila CBS 110553]|uniref:Uncharacterized protein n=1 Tax=Cladophialophora psammophila CBS 110553 TaxID=1182543 RepID=W9WGN5_9EURO|nr:uncharacterized protein A1O5_09729 [Cladophialophora psammophila CBS 110553]EXJ67083.1 hypothetical protein A1O5_09729 [Cladophialophora psammophila CBS 110553]